MSTPQHALIVIDMQRAFVDPDGRLAVQGADRVVEEVNRRVAAAVEAGSPVYYTRDVEPVELPEGDPDGQAELHPELDVRGEVVPKGPGRSGGFSGFVLFGSGVDQPGAGGLSPLGGLLLASGAEAVTVVGLAGDVCVAATARDAVRLGYRVSVDLDATAFVHAHPGGDTGAVRELRDAGVEIVGSL
ncbi:cysteine hydrolase family protein [Glycomyces tenuis]|uniref:cysteine hydrolase family protein n=1 Tax=Glycomyces tenuis TaxID=58116 RepID=UPI000429D7C9|nr:isochorismatase family cysteine hydrolase [Glycomyces tenuis]